MEFIAPTNADLIASVKYQLFNTGLPLSSLYQTLNIESGSFTVLPKNVSFPNLSSGIQSGYLSTSIAMEEIIAYLSKDVHNSVIIEYSSARKDDKWLKKRTYSMSFMKITFIQYLMVSILIMKILRTL